MDWKTILKDLEDFWDKESQRVQKQNLQFLGQITRITALGAYSREVEFWTEKGELLHPSHSPSLLPGDLILFGEKKKGVIHSINPEKGLFSLVDDGPSGGEYVGQKIILTKNNLAFLIDYQRELWAEMEEDPSPVFPLLQGLLTGHLEVPSFDPPEISLDHPAFSSLDSSQKKALSAMMTTPDFWLIWGPPGTGKTYCLSMALHLFLLQGRKILLTSHQHVAIDQVLLELIHHFPQHRPSILRVGHGARVHSEIEPLLLQNRLDSLHKNCHKNDGENNDENDTAEDLIERFPLVSATLSACTSSLLWDQTFQVVIQDEAGRAPLPLSLLGLLKAEKNFLLCGDPLQLRPIVPKKVKPWLQKSLLEIALEHREGPKRTTALTLHRRSHPTLVDHTSKFYQSRGHQGLTVPPNWQVEIEELEKSPEAILDRSTPLVYLNKPAPTSKWYKFGEAMSLVDPHESAMAYRVANLLAQTISYNRIWILTPFRLQTYLIASLFRSKHQKKKLVSTIDQTQGGEKDVVILSLTADKKATLQNKLDLNRLNVALTRARAKLIVVGHFLSMMECPNLDDFCTWILDQGVESDLLASPATVERAERKLMYLVKIKKKYRHQVDREFPYPTSEILAELALIPRKDRSLIRGIRRVKW